MLRQAIRTGSHRLTGLLARGNNPLNNRASLFTSARCGSQARLPSPTAELEGHVTTVILDWSGTTLDPYVMAPALVFVEIFEREGVPISMSEAREPMGLRKDLHIKAITENPDVARRWHTFHGCRPDQSDVDRMFAKFVPRQIEVLDSHAELIPGTVATVDTLKAAGICIGSTTGFSREMQDVLLRAARIQGYEPDVAVAGDDVLMPRPYPFMLFKNIERLMEAGRLKKFDMSRVVKVDDTPAGIGEGLNAGCWTIAVASLSNAMNIESLGEVSLMSDDELLDRQTRAREILQESGADVVISDIGGVPEAVDQINERISKGERPPCAMRRPSHMGG